jgi:hypothetical protein
MLKNSFGLNRLSLCLLVIAVMIAVATRAWTMDFSGEGNSGTVQADVSISPVYSIFSNDRVIPYKPVHNSGYVDLGGKIQSLVGKLSFFSAVHGGWIINRHVYLGLGAYALHAPKDQLNPSGYMWYDQSSMFYGGVEGGYRFPLNERINLRAQLLLGIISTNFFSQLNAQNGHMNVFSNDSMLIEPGVYADMKIWREFGISLGVHYHFTQGAEGPEGMNQSGLNQPGLELTVKWAGD